MPSLEDGLGMCFYARASHEYLFIVSLQFAKESHPDLRSIDAFSILKRSNGRLGPMRENVRAFATTWR